MKLTDYLVGFLADKGVNHVFGLTGGAVVHLFDSAARNGRIEPIFTHHEQAAAFAAQAYARVRNGLGACFVTTGPGATNALTGLTAAWLDSVPCFYVSGQARVAHTTRHKKTRQLGTQELDIIDVVSSLTNYAVMVEDPREFRYELEKAYHYATSGRPGPVWIDLPLDLQWADIDPAELRSFEAPPAQGLDDVTEAARSVVAMLKDSARPLLLAGYGVLRAGANHEFLQLTRDTGVPFVTTWGACDIAPHTEPLYVGHPGPTGHRGANLAMQNCDLMIVVGSHLCIPVTGTVLKSFARSARIVMVDIDRDELIERTVPVDRAICADAGDFLRALRQEVGSLRFGTAAWIEACGLYHRKYNEPVIS